MKRQWIGVGDIKEGERGDERVKLHYDDFAIGNRFGGESSAEKPLLHWIEQAQKNERIEETNQCGRKESYNNIKQTKKGFCFSLVMMGSTFTISGFFCGLSFGYI